MIHFQDWIEHKRKISIDEYLKDFDIAILGKFHLNKYGSKKENREINIFDFRSSLFSHRDFCTHSLIIYHDEYGTRVLKSRWTDEDTDLYMTHLRFDKWTR